MPNKRVAYKGDIIHSRFEELEFKSTKDICKGKEEFAIRKAVTQMCISKCFR